MKLAALSTGTVTPFTAFAAFRAAELRKQSQRCRSRRLLQRPSHDDLPSGLGGSR